ncbi:YqcC family protein [Vibrio sp. SM6]|uniref:YqcC family protein n=1 Tax=Vibrio agarilyticus TaxID=2726741 RepID=A0A7X8YGM4_9VIBR|nr:YqcC family protein [Vibrio agarilyticus]NLS13148.1 YqcC family protein [Vibrio agarilyticus]
MGETVSVKTGSIKTVLDAIESQLRVLDLWQANAPSAEALASEAPFAIDTLAPEAWLQWVFLPKMHTLLAQAQPLPRGFALEPYFSHVWQHEARYQPLLQLLQQLDMMSQ